MTVIRGNSRRPSGLCAIPLLTMVWGAAVVISRPSKRIEP